jgi:hypothetical protein
MSRDQLEAQLGALREQLELKGGAHEQELRWVLCRRLL